MTFLNYKHILFLVCFAFCFITMNAQQVYVTAGTASSYYHKTNKCEQIHQSDGALFAISITQAKSMGKKECQSCFKNNCSSSQNKPSSSTTQQVTKRNDVSLSTGAIELAKTAKGLTTQVISHVGYTTSYNSNWLIPNWVAYELTATEVDGTYPRPKKPFEPDPLVKGKSAVHGDYSNSGYSRGHMAPAADMKWSEQAMLESFYLSNICPQKADLNGGVWERLENRCRSLAKEGSVFICCGPIISGTPKRIGENKVAVPTGFYKVLCMKRKGKWQAIGFMFPNSACQGSMFDYACTVDEVEKTTGHDFFYNLSDDVEISIEATFKSKDWQ